MNRILRVREVSRYTGISKATIYRKIKARQFPKAVELAPQTVGWKESDIQAWIESLKPQETGEVPSGNAPEPATA